MRGYLVGEERGGGETDGAARNEKDVGGVGRGVDVEFGVGCAFCCGAAYELYAYAESGGFEVGSAGGEILGGWG